MCIFNCRAPPQYKTITLKRGRNGLGFSFVGGQGSRREDMKIFVKFVSVDIEGNLKKGDQIISVNGRSLERCTHDEAANILKNAEGDVTLIVYSS